ncbi:MAG: ParB/RepB/Spo0J family partition protein [Ruminococcaceae bacterium]|nr:ParB/RepB/Spo0J family partition protein [Oscillospiraceae bacterium]
MKDKITVLKIENLKEFEGHPYKVTDNEEMEALALSIKENGILSPVVVRPIEDTGDYEIISGHRRIFAAKKAGLTEVPASIYAISREEAIIALVDSNLHREHILPSEKAFAYKMKMDALSHQGKRTDLTSDQVGLKFSAEQVSNDDSATQVKRYIRLTNLIKPLLDMVDEGKIAFTPAVELSFLNDTEQADLVEVIEVCEATPNLSQAQRLKKISQGDGLIPEVIAEVLNEQKANQKERIKIPTEKLRKYFPKRYTAADMEKEIFAMLEKRYKEKQKDAR